MRKINRAYLRRVVVVIVGFVLIVCCSITLGGI